MNDITYVGLDVHKATVCVAIAERLVRSNYRRYSPKAASQLKRIHGNG
jgi:hypothetical protein